VFVCVLSLIGAKLAFIVLRYQMETMSAVISLDEREAGHSRRSGTVHGQQQQQQQQVVSSSSGFSQHYSLGQGEGDDRSETFHTPTEGVFTIPGQTTSFPGSVGHIGEGIPGLAPPLPVSGMIPVAQPVVPATTTFSSQPVQTGHYEPPAQPAVTFGQDYAGAQAGEKHDLGASGVPADSQRVRRRKDRDELASVDSSDESSSGSEDDSTDYDTEYDDAHGEGAVTEEFIRWIEHLRRESLVHITGTIQKPNNSTGKIKEASTDLNSIELKVEKCFVIGRVQEHAPFQFNEIEGHHVANEEEKQTGAHLQREAEEGGAGKISVRQELMNRTFDLRVSWGFPNITKRHRTVLTSLHTGPDQSSYLQDPGVRLQDL
jgi:hypothetical protein